MEQEAIISNRNEDVINFDLEPVQVPVIVKKRQYVLVEASGGAEARYKNCLFKSTKIGPNGKPCGIDGMADAEPLLVSLCLYEAILDTEGRPALKLDANGEPDPRMLVPEQTIRRWPSRIQRMLFDRVKAISGMNDEAETEETVLAKIDELRKRLNELRGDPLEKKLLSDGMDGSDWQGNSASTSIRPWGGVAR